MKKWIVALALIITLSACSSGEKKETEGKVLTQAEKQVQKQEEKKEEGKETTNEEKKEDEGSTKNKGIPAPEFTLKDMDGNDVSFADLKGKKVYLKFWASWCHVCTEHMPELEALVEQDNDFEVYTIVADKNNGEMDMEAFKAWYDKKGYSKKIKVLFDNGDTNLMQQYGIRAFPTNAFIGSDGVLVGIAMGAASNEQIAEVMASIQ
ncbi:MAG: TlpA disulfide reductase family protein [Eubacteriales bacterium]|nr:TlpA disulfide reductase family protein [Eubacteriales bacterium]